MDDDWGWPYPSDLDWVSTEDLNQGNVKVEFAAPTPPSILKVETYASYESSISDYCRFAQLVLILLVWKELIGF